MLRRRKFAPNPLVDATRLAEGVDRLVALVETLPAIDEGSLIDALVGEGFDRATATRLVAFVPVAFGRAMLKKLGVVVNPSYQVIDRHQRVTGSHPLASSPEFAAATEAVPRATTHGDAFQILALMSSEVLAVNNALQRGSNPADLEISPVVVML